jgi:hypothetical protein
LRHMEIVHKQVDNAGYKYAAMAILSNDEISTDDELREHFKNQMKLNDETIDGLLKLRTKALKGELQ